MEFTPEQQLVFDKYISGENIFITGPGGVGKSELIRFIYHDACRRGKNIMVTATTGCAAIRLNCNARTIHSWAGIGLGKKSAKELVKKMKQHSWKEIEILVVDEVSMMPQTLFELLNDIAQLIRKNTKYYGGIQIIFSGDFFQLPPVGDPCFCFESLIWNHVFPNQIELTQIFRQKDETYAKILRQIREGIIKKTTNLLLLSRVKPSEGVVTKLYPTRARVDNENRINMAKLTGEEHVYEISIKGNQVEGEIITKGLLCETNLVLKEGAQVMCIINVMNDSVLELVNGSQGIVTGFMSGFPIVKFQNGIHRVITPHLWEGENSTVSQIPLILAWAISIHKSQGATLDTAEIDIGSGIFECGQTYVALSRVKSLEGLYLTSYDPTKIKINAKVKNFYKELNI